MATEMQVQVQNIVAPPMPPTPGSSILKAFPSLYPPDGGCFVHPGLSPAVDPQKDRMFRASEPLAAGTVILVDAAYAIVPSLASPTRSPADSFVCSNLPCSRRVKEQSMSLVRCPRECEPSVVWCSPSCQTDDSARHDYECAWLKQKGPTLRLKESEYDFITLWHVVRLLSGWSVEQKANGNNWKGGSRRRGKLSSGWKAVVQCCQYLDSWPKSQVEHWTRLVDEYLSDSSLLPGPFARRDMIRLICIEETNTFGLYPRPTGLPSRDETQSSRGTCYGVGLYPRAAMFNHSCLPNVSLIC